MMSLHDRLKSLRCVMLRYNPIRHPVGLLASGTPGPTSPVVVSGNYFHTVKRLQRALEGFDCWILVACSAGINVWCAAGVCDFNEHKIADAVHAVGLADVVEGRTLILPQLAAVGVDLGRLKTESGFDGVWGPASLDDLPAWLRDGGPVDERQRLVRMPLLDCWYNSVGMFNVFLLLPLLGFLFVGTSAAHVLLLANGAAIFGSFMLYDLLPCRHPSNKTALLGLVVLALVAADGCWWRPVEASTVWLRLGLTAFVFFLVAIDMLGSTPFYKTTIAHWLTTLNDDSLFQPEVTAACVGCGACVDVCPKGIFRLGDLGVVVADRGRECCECLACVKQCPTRAIVNMNGTVHKEDIKSVPDLDEIMRHRD